MIGTYLFLAVVLAAAAWVVRKLWSHDRGSERMVDARDAGGHDEHA